MSTNSRFGVRNLLGSSQYAYFNHSKKCLKGPQNQTPLIPPSCAAGWELRCMTFMEVALCSFCIQCHVGGVITYARLHDIYNYTPKANVFFAILPSATASYSNGRYTILIFSSWASGNWSALLQLSPSIQPWIMTTTTTIYVHARFDWDQIPL
jgi:hypothetical protein